MSVDKDADTGMQRNHLMGGEPTQMNLAKLMESAKELGQEIQILLDDLQSNAAGKTFRQVLTQLDVAGRKFALMQRQLRPQLQFYVAHPMYVTDHNAQVVTEQLSNMPIPEMREVDAHLLSGIPDGTHAPHAREAKLREISGIPTRHNKSISENAKPGQVLHEKSALQTQIRGKRLQIQQHVVQLRRQLAATKQSASQSANSSGTELDANGKQVLAAIKKGQF